jgi:prepilin-type N-terminal cleavage/methylation domain-containing protein
MNIKQRQLTDSPATCASFLGPRSSLAPRPSILAPRAFTLVELLVVITIIGILASLITVAAVGALRKARETEIKTEVDQITTALDTYKDKATSYPPNCQIDDTSTTGTEPASTPLNEQQVLNDLKRHLKQAFPRHQESENLLRVLCGLSAIGSDSGDYTDVLEGGMSAGEALVFWLGGFSSDPKHPITGEGGPAYRIQSKGAATNASEDPIETRKWTFPFDVGRLRPRADDGYFDQSEGNRFIEFTVRINGVQQFRRINFWQYVPRKSDQPYLYFDTSRHPAAEKEGSAVTSSFDPPAATSLNPNALHVHAFKKAHPNYTDASGPYPPIQYVNPEKFQVIHCGIDDAWHEEEFEKMSVHGVDALNLATDELESYLIFPDGPFIGEIADTIVNFSPVTRVEDAQP